MQIHNVEQGSPEWLKLRIEHPFTSSVATAIGNAGKGLETLVLEKLGEKYSSANKDQLKTAHIDRGNELEPQARAIYELETGKNVEQVGFITNSKISPLGGVSPDGLVGNDGLVEIKSPSDKVYIEYLLSGKIDTGYMWQMQMQMLFSERKWCDYVVFNPNFEKPIIIVRVNEDLEMQEKLKTGLKLGEDMYKLKDKELLELLK